VVVDSLRSWPIVPLAASHDRRAFESGVDVLDRYLKEQATQDQRRHIAACFVLADSDQKTVAGFYTLSAFTVAARELPAELARKLPKYGQIPCTLLGRLAIDLKYRGHGAGRTLLIDAMRRSLMHADGIASWAVVVDAKNDTAREFYTRYGFLALLDAPNRLFMPMGTIAELFP
jgi:predicted GNAT family N-acyltransferase